MITCAVIPAAGLGTRLRPLTATTPKELLPLGASHAQGDAGALPAIAGALLEAQAAGIERVAVVISPRKEALRAWLESGPFGALEIHIALQPEPLGVLDAVARGLALLNDPEAFAVLYPDYLHLPDQRALSQLALHAPEGDAVVFGLTEVTEASAARSGLTARAITAPLAGPLRRIVALEATGALEPGAVHTTFAELRGPCYAAALDRTLHGASPRDGVHLEVLGELARRGLLFGVMLDGDILDLGVMAGYEDAARRFEAGAARWRADPRESS